VGHATRDGQLVVTDAHFGSTPIDVPLELMLGKPPRMTREARRIPVPHVPLRLAGVSVAEALERVLRLPVVADKSFLITIGDRTVGGLVARDPLVGRWQVPVADAAVTLTDFFGYSGEALAMGERAPVALLDAAASVRLAVGEALLNIASAPIARLGDVKLSANWMCAAGHPGEDARLYEAVRAVGAELCPALGIAIPVGKDSMSMKTVWEEHGQRRSVTAPLSLVVSAFAPVTDVRQALTPALVSEGDTELLWVDLGRGQRRLGGSALAQVYDQLGDRPPDLDRAEDLKALFTGIQELCAEALLLAYHDCSDGGLIVTLLEMAFAGGTGLDIHLAGLPEGDAAAALGALFAEELGVVLQVRTGDAERVHAVLERHGLGAATSRVGAPAATDRVRVTAGGEVALDASRFDLRRTWSETTHALQRLRDDPACADEEQALRVDPEDPGRFARATFDLEDDVAAPFIARGTRPRIAILREQGVNGHVEMAAAFHRAGFEAVDVHTSDLVAGRAKLAGFVGLAACGGFSYGDVLGAGEGWAKSVLFEPRARDELSAFFARSGTFTLGVCNGCQMMSALRELVPGAERWPRFVRNRSDQFEARVCLVEIQKSPSILLGGMAGSQLPVVVSHGEGRAEIEDEALRGLERDGLVAARYIDHRGTVTEHYPENPNGSPRGVTAFTTPDGRVTIMMPHPERVFRAVQLSWRPPEWGEASPWMRLFRNARVWVG
jgi:phosphoribosylformylglycinamidine synthase